MLQLNTTDLSTDSARAFQVEPVPAAAPEADPPSCANCYLRNVCLPCGLSEEAILKLENLTRVKRRIMRGAALYREGHLFHSLYAIRSGSFKNVGTAGAAQKKVTGLHLPGEILGLDAISTQVHGYDAVALEDAEVCVLEYAQFTQLTLRLPELQAHLLRALSGDIARDRGLLLRLGGMTAEQRVVAFLLSLSARYQKLGYAGTRFSVRMARQDIASYLGLTIETVCRLLSRLQRDGLIEAQGREVRLKELPRLRKLVGY
jgi:CRP/FNR family transcriptional regulator, anaerobic regulatory protein